MQKLYKLESVKDLTPEVKQIILKPKSQVIVYRAGQYVDFVLSAENRRPFSIANAPQKSGVLEFHVKHTQDNEFTDGLFKILDEQGQLEIDGPFGHCVLPDNPKQEITMLAGGTGIVPMKALLEEMVYLQVFRPTHLYWAVKHESDLYLKPQLMAWCQQYDFLRFFPVIFTPLHQYIDREKPIFAEQIVYAAGPYPMVRAVYNSALALGVEKSTFLSDML